MIYSGYNVKWETNWWYKVTLFAKKAIDIDCWYCYLKEKSMYDGVHGYFTPINISTWLKLTVTVKHHRSSTVPMGIVKGRLALIPEVLINLNGLVNVGFLPTMSRGLIMEFNKDQQLAYDGANINIEQYPDNTIYFSGNIS